jgi:hypothetical protein
MGEVVTSGAQTIIRRANHSRDLLSILGVLSGPAVVQLKHESIARGKKREFEAFIKALENPTSA